MYTPLHPLDPKGFAQKQRWLSLAHSAVPGAAAVAAAALASAAAVAAALFAGAAAVAAAADAAAVAAGAVVAASQDHLNQALSSQLHHRAVLHVDACPHVHLQVGLLRALLV